MHYLVGARSQFQRKARHDLQNRRQIRDALVETRRQTAGELERRTLHQVLPDVPRVRLQVDPELLQFRGELEALGLLLVLQRTERQSRPPLTQTGNITDVFPEPVHDVLAAVLGGLGAAEHRLHEIVHLHIVVGQLVHEMHLVERLEVVDRALERLEGRVLVEVALLQQVNEIVHRFLIRAHLHEQRAEPAERRQLTGAQCPARQQRHWAVPVSSLLLVVPQDAVPGAQQVDQLVIVRGRLRGDAGRVRFRQVRLGGEELLFDLARR